jgi:hypothetical protein
VSSTTESTAVFVKMDPQPERIEGGWKMLMFAEYDYPDYVAWSDATDFAAPPKDMTEKIGRALIMNRAPYKPGDTFRDWRYSYVVKSIEPVIRDGAWWWRIGVETRSDP